MKFFITSILAALFSMSIMAQADDLSDRKALMKSINGYMKILNAQKNDFNGGVVAEQGRNIGAAFNNSIKLYAEKGTGETKALDSIWSDTAGFSAALANGIEMAKNLELAGEANDAALFGEAFNNLARSCGGCHRKYRAKR